MAVQSENGRGRSGACSASLNGFSRPVAARDDQGEGAAIRIKCRTSHRTPKPSLRRSGGWRRLVTTSWKATSGRHPVTLKIEHPRVAARSGSPPQPGGRKKIAQHFSAGSAPGPNPVPAGTKETTRRPASVVPAGTFRFTRRQPGTEVLGCFRSSLWDCTARPAPGARTVPVRSGDAARKPFDLPAVSPRANPGGVPPGTEPFTRSGNGTTPPGWEALRTPFPGVSLVPRATRGYSRGTPPGFVRGMPAIA